MADVGCRKNHRVRTASFQTEWRPYIRLRILTWTDGLGAIRTGGTATRIRLAARVIRNLMGLAEVTHESNPTTTAAEVAIPAETSRQAGGSRRIIADEGTIRRHR